ncbi:MAG: HAD family phosphatase [Bacteroidia bacterium]|nr:HAD family phosphatase [Bacteroidia bacterium]
MNNIRNIIFDLGGVLIDWQPSAVYKTIFDTSEEVDWFLDNICTMEWNVIQDAGRSLKEATEVLQRQHPDWHDEIAAFYGRWTEMLVGPITGTVDLLSVMKQRKTHNIFALTNWSSETFPIALERYDFLHWFEGIVVSGEEKCKKPDPKIYNTLLDRYHLNANECLFIDDNLENVNAAKELDMEAFHFESPGELKLFLQSLELI